MPIERIGSGVVRPFTPEDKHGAKGVADDGLPSEGSSGGRRSDSVELSKQGLARAAGIAEENDVTGGRGIEIRMRIAAAFYDEPSVALEVARRLIDSGDLHDDPTNTT